MSLIMARSHPRRSLLGLSRTGLQLHHPLHGPKRLGTHTEMPKDNLARPRMGSRHKLILKEFLLWKSYTETPWQWGRRGGSFVSGRAGERPPNFGPNGLVRLRTGNRKPEESLSCVVCPVPPVSFRTRNTDPSSRRHHTHRRPKPSSPVKTCGGNSARSTPRGRQRRDANCRDAGPGISPSHCSPPYPT